MGCCIPQFAGELMRSFVCIEIPDEQKETLQSWIANQRKLFGNEIRWVRPETMHITLRFCGERPMETVSKILSGLNKIEGTGIFELSLEGCGGFPNLKKPYVIWTGIVDKAKKLQPISKQVERIAVKAGVDPERRPFSPHVTLGRRNVNTSLNETLKSSIEGSPIKTAPWTVTEIKLMQSRLLPSGPEYTPLGVFKI